MTMPPEQAHQVSSLATSPRSCRSSSATTPRTASSSTAAPTSTDQAWPAPPRGPHQLAGTGRAAACNFTQYAQSKEPDIDEIIVYLCREPRPGQTPEETVEYLRPLGRRLSMPSPTPPRTRSRSSASSTTAGGGSRATCPGCCEGEPIPALDDPHSVTAQLIRLGYTPGRRTSDIVKEFQPSDPGSPRTPAPRPRQRERRLGPTMQRYSPEQDTPSTHPRTPGNHDAGLQRRRHRDRRRHRRPTHPRPPGQWLRDHGLEFIEDDDLPHARRLWATLARRCIPPYTDAAIAALTLLARSPGARTTTPSHASPSGMP